MKGELALDLLAMYGLKPVDLHVYVFLSRRGLCKCKDICSKLELEKQKLYPSLKRLRDKGLVNVTSDRPAYFSANPFERVVESLIKSMRNEARDMKLQKQELISAWRSLALG